MFHNKLVLANIYILSWLWPISMSLSLIHDVFLPEQIFPMAWLLSQQEDQLLPVIQSKNWSRFGDLFLFWHSIWQPSFQWLPQLVTKLPADQKNLIGWGSLCQNCVWPYPHSYIFASVIKMFWKYVQMIIIVTYLNI